MYIIDIISCTNWLFALLGSYKKWSCAVQVVLRKELGRVQGKIDCFFPFFGNFDGEENVFKPHSTTGFQG